jgi:hypothetical protein
LLLFALTAGYWLCSGANCPSAPLPEESDDAEFHAFVQESPSGALLFAFSEFGYGATVKRRLDSSWGSPFGCTTETRPPSSKTAAALLAMCSETSGNIMQSISPVIPAQRKDRRGVTGDSTSHLQGTLLEMLLSAPFGVPDPNAQKVIKEVIVSDERVFQIIHTRAGDAYNAEQLKKDTDALLASNQFRSVEVRYDMLTDQQVSIHFVVIDRVPSRDNRQLVNFWISCFR